VKLSVYHFRMPILIITIGRFLYHSLSHILQVFSIFEELGISVDVVATSEVSISLTLDPSKMWERELIKQASVTNSLLVSLIPLSSLWFAL
jgi:hypothetical protein